MIGNRHTDNGERDNKAKHAESERQKQYVKVGKKSYCNKKSVADKPI